MENSFLSVMMNLLMAGLLLATIIYCLKLNRRIRLLQDSKSDLARIIREFDDSTRRATQSINEIHAATMRISENIQHKIDKASYLADDLEVMIEKGNKLAGRTDSTPVRPQRLAEVPGSTTPKRSLADIMPARSHEAVQKAAPEQSSQPDIGRRPLRVRSRAEQELLSLLGGRKNKKQGE